MSGPTGTGTNTTASHWDTSYEWKAVTLLTIGFGLVGLDRWIIAPLAPAMIGDLGISPQDVNNLVAVLGVTWGVAALIMGGISDRIGRRKVLVPAIILFSLMSGFSGAVSSFAMLFIVRAAMGVAEGAFCPTSFAATAEATKPSRRGFNQGLQQSTFPLFGLGFAPIIATQLQEQLHMSWRSVFLLVAIPGLIIGFLLWKVIREPATVQAHTRAAADPTAPQVAPAKLSELMKHRNVPLGMIGLLAAMCGIFTLSANIPLYLTEVIKLTPVQMGFVTSAIGFGGFAGMWALPAVSDYIGRRTTAIIGFVLAAVFIWLFMRTGADMPKLFGYLFAGTAFNFGLLPLITGPIATEAAPIGRISTTAGLIIGSGEVFGGGLALVVAGAVISAFGIPAMLYLALGGLVVGTVLSLFLKETAPRLVKSGHGAESALDKFEDKHPEGIAQ